MSRHTAIQRQAGDLSPSHLPPPVAICLLGKYPLTHLLQMQLSTSRHFSSTNIQRQLPYSHLAF